MAKISKGCIVHLGQTNDSAPIIIMEEDSKMLKSRPSNLNHIHRIIVRLRSFNRNRMLAYCCCLGPIQGPRWYARLVFAVFETICLGRIGPSSDFRLSIVRVVEGILTILGLLLWRSASARSSPCLGPSSTSASFRQMTRVHRGGRAATEPLGLSSLPGSSSSSPSS